jgi:hypothetical protein
MHPGRYRLYLPLQDLKQDSHDDKKPIIKTKIRSDKTMNDTAKQVIDQLVSKVWSLPIEDYLASEDFLRFCRKHKLSDEWSKYLELSRDIPHLYGSSVWKNAFTLFLSHLYHHRPDEFLFLFAGLLADFSRGISCDLPVDGIRSSLLLFGYPASTADRALFMLKVNQEPAPEPSGAAVWRENGNPEALKRP